jgi:hypothetical protein
MRGKWKVIESDGAIQNGTFPDLPGEAQAPGRAGKERRANRREAPQIKMARASGSQKNCEAGGDARVLRPLPPGARTSEAVHSGFLPLLPKPGAPAPAGFVPLKRPAVRPV